MTYTVSCDIPGVEDTILDTALLEEQFGLLAQYWRWRRYKTRAEQANSTLDAKIAEERIQSIEHQMLDWAKQIAWGL